MASFLPRPPSEPRQGPMSPRRNKALRLAVAHVDTQDSGAEMIQSETTTPEDSTSEGGAEKNVQRRVSFDETPEIQWIEAPEDADVSPGLLHGIGGLGALVASREYRLRDSQRAAFPLQELGDFADLLTEIAEDV
ncbi:unnamed protein product [Symbiodinium sp. CCMP2456]|nr:unnamed protein product [Symbiodinium sp. CCMP2456]